MEYSPLEENTIIDYLRRRPAMEQMLRDGEPYTIKEIGDGNLNLVFILQSQKDEKLSFVLKQTLPYLRVVGD